MEVTRLENQALKVTAMDHESALDVERVQLDMLKESLTSMFIPGVNKASKCCTACCDETANI